MRTRPLLLIAATALLVIVPGLRRAGARSGALLSYPINEVWATAVRFLRVDRNYAVIEKDAESGYVLFELTENRKAYKGALELVHTIDGEGRDATQAMFSLPDLPRHFEQMLLDKLAAKVKEERGTPPPAPKKPPPGKHAPDAGLPRPPSRGDLPRPGAQ